MPPYVPFIEALQDHARNCSTEQLQAQLGTSAPDIALLLPEVRRRLPHLPASAPLDAPSARYRLFESITDFLLTVARASAATGLLLWLDDLHWADEATLLLLEHLDRRIAAAPLLVVATYRDTEVDTGRPLARALERLTRQGPEAAPRVGLQRFPQADTATLFGALAGREPPAPLVRAVHAHTDGNPFFVHEVYRYLAATGWLFDAQGAWHPGVQLGEMDLPPSVRLVLDRRLESVSEACRRALTAAAGIGRTFTFALLHATADQEETTLLNALDEAGRAHLLGSTAEDAEGRMSFAHELIRQTLLAGLSLPRRQQLHRRVAEAIEQLYAADLGPHAAALAALYRLAGAAGDATKAVAYAQRAAEAAEQVLASEEAIAHWQAALALTPSADERARCKLVLRLGNALDRGRNEVASRPSFLEAAGLARRLHLADALARAVLGFSRVVAAQTLTEATALLEDALRAVSEEDLGLRVALLSQLALSLWLARDARVAAVSQDTVDLARRLQEPLPRARSPASVLLHLGTQHRRDASRDHGRGGPAV